MNHSILQGKRGIIFGALDEQSIAWEVALAAKKAGAIFTLSNAPVAIRMGSIKELAEICQCELISADATNLEDIRNLINQSIQILGGSIDFVLHAVGMSPNVRKKRAYTNLDYSYFEKTLDISALSFHKFLQTAWQMDALAPKASVVALSVILQLKKFFQVMVIWQMLKLL
jgi:enoyl-[acyl-carrier protein] reductase I